MFQMLDRTWQHLLKQYGAACDVPQDTPSTDNVARRKLLDAYIEDVKNNTYQIKKE
jgi:hypothetical protein